MQVGIFENPFLLATRPPIFFNFYFLGPKTIKQKPERSRLKTTSFYRYSRIVGLRQCSITQYNRQTRGGHDNNIYR